MTPVLIPMHCSWHKHGLMSSPMVIAQTLSLKPLIDAMYSTDSLLAFTLRTVLPVAL